MSNDTHNTFCVTTKEQLDDAVKDVILGIFEEGGDGDAAILVPPEYMYITQLVIDTHLPNWEKKISEEMITWHDNQEALHLSLDTVTWCSYSELRNNLGTYVYPATFIYTFDFSRGSWE